MKKIFALFVGILFIMVSFLLPQKGDTVLDVLLLENVEAMADPEVEIEAICMGTSGICIVYPNGFFIRGQRVG